MFQKRAVNYIFKRRTEMQTQILNDRILAVMVLYNPDQDTFDNIKMMSAFFEEFLIVDNSEVNIAEKKIRDLNLVNVTYIPLNENVGLSIAYNRAARYAIDNGYQWMLLFDQDSVFLENPLPYYQRYLSQEKLAVLCPKYLTPKNKVVKEKGVKKLKRCMSSGSLINLSIFSEIGPFDENLFIEYVDFDYCQMVNNKKYYICQINDLVMQHRPGIIKSKRIGFKKINYSSSSAIRKYYVVRNSLYMSKKYCKINYYLIARIKLWIKTFIFHDGETKEIHEMIKLAKEDFKHGKFGKCNFN